MFSCTQEYHSQTVRELEQVLTTYLKKGTIPTKRPTLRIGGFMGMGGTTHDAIDFLTAKVQRLESKIEVARDSIDTKKVCFEPSIYCDYVLIFFVVQTGPTLRLCILPQSALRPNRRQEARSQKV